MDSLTIIFILNAVFFISFFLLKNIYIPLILSLLTLFTLLFISKTKKLPSIQDRFKLPGLALNNDQYIMAIVCLIIFLVLEKFIGFNGSLFATFFIFAYLNKLDSRTSFFIALILLVITALFSIGGRTRIAEDVAIMVYYFLVVGVVWQIIEMRQDKSDDIEAIKQELDEIVIKKYISQPKFSFDFFTEKKLIIISSIFSIFLVIILFNSLYQKSRLVKKLPSTLSTTPTINITTKIFKNVPFSILNATDIRGYAASNAAILRTSGWEKEFDISIGNYDGTASANLLRYTKNLKEKIKPLEKDLKIQVTPIIIKQSTHEAEMILILGD